MTLAFYVTIDELKRGGYDCEITYERPKYGYVKVLVDKSANCGRGANYVYFKDRKLAEEYRNGPRGSEWENEELGPTVGLLSDALETLTALGIA